MKNKFYTLQEINEITHTSVDYLKKLIKNGTLKATRISKDYLVSEYDFYKFIELMEVKVNEK
ncbi:MAG TPA: helix-turn-helix domain-containing protein [Gallicola sp.]|nr:helix-turn-helix domain-containing protein [Gallicola sp.]